MILFAACTTAATPSAFQLAGQTLKVPMPIEAISIPSNTWSLEHHCRKYGKVAAYQFQQRYD